MHFHRTADSLPLLLGDRVPMIRFATALGSVVDISRRSLPTHVQFRASLRENCDLGSFIRRRAEVARAAHELLVFRSPEEELLLLAGTLPFDMVADPEQVLFDAFCVRGRSPERSYRQTTVDGDLSAVCRISHQAGRSHRGIAVRRRPARAVDGRRRARSRCLDRSPARRSERS